MDDVMTPALCGPGFRFLVKTESQSDLFVSKDVIMCCAAGQLRALPQGSGRRLWPTWRDAEEGYDGLQG